MSRFADFAGEVGEPEPNVSGSFDCQTCDESVTGAYLDPLDRALRWFCSNEHVSTIKDFM